MVNSVSAKLPAVLNDLRHSGVMRLPSGYPADKHQKSIGGYECLDFQRGELIKAGQVP